jgi:threonylcarbamoyladenosine tRNA methylthiotransferase MtaB
VKYAILTFGCRANQADSFHLERALSAAGAQSTPVSAADFVVVNTCSVTAVADQTARQAVRRVARDNPSARIVVTGCYATRRPAEVARLPGVASLLPNRDKDCVLEAVGLGLRSERPGPNGTMEGGFGATLRPGALGRTAYPLLVQTGCDEQCTYCIVPTTRGSGRSVPLESLRSEVARTVAAGFKEFVVTGVHLGSYGRDLCPPVSLADLLRLLDDQPGDLLFRISSLEPMDFTPAVESQLVSSPRFAPHFHLPLQHASDRILRAMGRPYTLEAYERLVNRLRGRLPDAAIGSDIMVGFPGETETDFRTTVDYLLGSPLTYLHAFAYSDRPGTAAAGLLAKVHSAEVKARMRELRAVARQLARRFQCAQIGRERRGLTLKDGSMVLTDNYLKVRVPPGRLRNEWVRVKLLADGDPMTGVVTEQITSSYTLSMAAASR